jgi:isoquinoline 1-oxidoreductase beta subunit
MKNDQPVSRRNFIKLSGMTGAALSLGFYLPASAEESEIISRETAATLGIELNAWISIDTSGKVTIINHRAEMGQGSYQSVPQIIAEELEVDLNDVQIVFGVGNSSKYGSQITGGSSTIRGSYKRLGQLAASARHVLVQSAAKRWNVDAATCYAESGKVIHRPTGKKLGYGELVEEASKLEVPKKVELKKPENYKILRKPIPRQDTPLKTNGKAIFGLDKRLPGMMYAVVERNPRFLGKVKSFDDSATRKVAGVKHVFTVKMPVFNTTREGVAVVADNLWSAMQGRKALKVEWDDTGFEHHSTEQMYAAMNDDLKTKEGISYKTKGDVNGQLATAEKKLEATYETPYESHSCMEPVNCIAHVKDDSCEIWGPIQGPDWIQDDISSMLKLPKEKVTVNMTFLGGGFGRKAFTDYPQEAVMISKEIKGPVQVVWTREDDTTQGPFRPGMVYQLNGALTKNGRIAAFKYKMAGQNMDHQWPGANAGLYNSSATEGFLEGYLESLPHYSFADIPLKSPVPVMWWRSVYSSTNGFAFESFLDEMAVAADKDPLDFRKQYLEKERYHILIDKLQEVSGWKQRGKNEGWGVAITECFGSVVGEVVKVSKKAEGGVKIDKVWAVMDCGWYVNPDIIKAQVEGSIVMALAAATKHATTFKDGKAVETNFNSYPQLRINECPDIEVYNIDNDEPAGGVGEPGLPPLHRHSPMQYLI